MTILHKMRMKKGHRSYCNPWCAFESVFTEPPFDLFDMQVAQVSMLYHTVKDHLKRHVPVLSPRPTESLWDYVPEFSIHDEKGHVPRHEVDPKNAATAQEEEKPIQEDEDANMQWVEQMMNASDASMPFKYKVANLIVALLATTLAIITSFDPTTADSSATQLQ